MLKKHVLENTIIRYSIIMAVVIAACGLFLAAGLSSRLKTYMIESHLEHYTNSVKLVISQSDVLKNYFETSGKDVMPEEINADFMNFFRTGDVFRVEAWDLSGNNIWSNRGERQDVNRANDSSFIKALSGIISYHINESYGEDSSVASQAHGLEQSAILLKKKVLEIDVPVYSERKMIGVVTLYEADEGLFLTIEKNTNYVWLFMVLSGVIFYLLQFFVFYQTFQNQRKSNLQLHETQNVTLTAMAHLTETRDSETRKHLDRTTLYVKLLATALRRNRRYSDYLTKEYIRDLTKSAPLHDIGKVGVQDTILKKPGKLTVDEFEIMKKHSVDGAATLEEAEKKLSFQSFLKIAIPLASSHHEKWNGEGYPHGLKKDEIPLSARIMALADVYDALRSKRTYKDPLTHEDSKQVIMEESGKHFDPQIVAAFIEVEEEFRRISEDLKD